MPVNVVLQLYQGGWREQTADVVANNLRVEGVLGTGSLEREGEAIRVATRQLELYAEPTRSETVGVQPVDYGDTPWLSHRPGSTVELDAEQELVESLSYTRDEDGLVTFAAELGGHIDTPEERSQSTANKMSKGDFGGLSKVAQPLSTIPSIDTYRPAAVAEGCECSWALVEGDGTSIDPDNPHDISWITIDFQGGVGGWSISGGSLIPPPGSEGNLVRWHVHAGITANSGVDDAKFYFGLFDQYGVWEWESWFPAGWPAAINPVTIASQESLEQFAWATYLDAPGAPPDASGTVTIYAFVETTCCTEAPD